MAKQKIELYGPTYDLKNSQPFRIYADGREFGIDYETVDAAAAVALEYSRNFPTVTYELRQGGRFVMNISDILRIMAP